MLDSQPVHQSPVVCTHELPVSMMKLRINYSNCEERKNVIGKRLDSNAVTRYWLDAVRHQPERNDNVFPSLVSIIRQETLIHSDKP